MTHSSRADRAQRFHFAAPTGLSAGLTGLVMLFGATVAPVSAQTVIQPDEGVDDTPLQLFPTAPAVEDGTPEGQIDQPEVPPSGILSEDLISVERLSGIDPDTVGLLDEGNGGIGIDMWQGTSRSRLQQMIRDLPDQIPSPSLRMLARNLLLSTAELPELAEGESLPTTQEGSLLKARLGKLMAMGYVQETLDLIRAADGALEREPDLIHMVLKAQLLQGDLGSACALVREQEDNLAEAFWQKRLVLCQLLDGNVTAAQFGATLLQDEGIDDPLFFTLVERITDKRDIALPPAESMNEVHLALMWLSQTPVPENLLASAEPAMLRAIAENPHTNLEVRLEAAESAARMGAIQTGTLAEIYKSVSFSQEELLKPLSIAQEEFNARSRALLYQASSIETVPETKALLVRKALELAREAGIYSLAVEVHANQILQLPVSADQWDFASEAARALYAIGRPKPAEAWLSHLDIQAQRDPEAAEAKTALWALSRLASDSYDLETDDAARRKWAELTLRTAPDQSEFVALRRIQMTYSLLEAVERQPVALAAWTEILDLPRTRHATLPNPALERLMADAAQNGRKAETAAWVLWVLSDTGPALSEPAILASAITSLRLAGLEKQAYDIAIEAALQNGL